MPPIRTSRPPMRTTATASFVLSGTLAPGAVAVIYNPGFALPAIPAGALVSGGVINFNGDDALTLETNGVVASGLRHGPKDRTDGDVADRCPDGRVDLGDRMRRQSDHRTGSHDVTNGSGRKVILTDVHAVRAGQPRDVCAIVDDDTRAGVVRALGDVRGLFEQRAAAHRLRANLQQRCPAIEARRREVEHRPSRAGRPIGVDRYAHRSALTN